MLCYCTFSGRARCSLFIEIETEAVRKYGRIKFWRNNRFHHAYFHRKNIHKIKFWMAITEKKSNYFSSWNAIHGSFKWICKTAHTLSPMPTFLQYLLVEPFEGVQHLFYSQSNWFRFDDSITFIKYKLINFILDDVCAHARSLVSIDELIRKLAHKHTPDFLQLQFQLLHDKYEQQQRHQNNNNNNNSWAKEAINNKSHIHLEWPRSDDWPRRLSRLIELLLSSLMWLFHSTLDKTMIRHKLFTFFVCSSVFITWVVIFVLTKRSTFEIEWWPTNFRFQTLFLTNPKKCCTIFHSHVRKNFRKIYVILQRNLFIYYYF